LPRQTILLGENSLFACSDKTALNVEPMYDGKVSFKKQHLKFDLFYFSFTFILISYSFNPQEYLLVLKDIG
jgi:hypothetical protein